MQAIGKLLMMAGALLLLSGATLWLLGRSGGTDLRLPGDIVIERPGFRLYLPLGTSLAVSLLLTLILYFLRRFRG